MRRAALTTSATVAGVVLLLSLKPHRAPVPPPVTAGPSGNGSSSAGGGSGAAGTAVPRDGTYRGQTVTTRYGPVQVEVTLSRGRLARVRAVRVPSENGRDREIAAFAVPRLTREALAAGNARIDAVSGATYTSEGYITSLQSALDRAGA